MNSYQIYKAIGDTDDVLLERSERKAAKRPVWIRLGAAAACLCLLAVGSVALYGQRAPVSTEAPGVIISSYASGQSGSIYAPPENGKTLFFSEVQAALDANAEKNATYFVSMDVYRDGVSLDPAGNEMRAELQRLSENGCKVGFATGWTYQGEDGEQADMSYAAGYFTAEQLEGFPASTDYGYAFSFASNGDGSAVSPEQTLSSEFPA